MLSIPEANPFGKFLIACRTVSQETDKCMSSGTGGSGKVKEREGGGCLYRRASCVALDSHSIPESEDKIRTAPLMSLSTTLASMR